MRLDQFLKISRIVLRRSLAQELCDAGLVRVNGQRAKSSKEIRAGDEIELRRRHRLTKVIVSEVPSSKQVSKSSAGDLYQVISESQTNDDPYLV